MYCNACRQTKKNHKCQRKDESDNYNYGDDDGDAQM